MWVGSIRGVHRRILTQYVITFLLFSSIDIPNNPFSEVDMARRCV